MYRLSRTLPNLGPATPARPGMANHPPPRAFARLVRRSRSVAQHLPVRTPPPGPHRPSGFEDSVSPASEDSLPTSNIARPVPRSSSRAPRGDPPGSGGRVGKPGVFRGLRRGCRYLSNPGGSTSRTQAKTGSAFSAPFMRRAGRLHLPRRRMGPAEPRAGRRRPPLRKRRLRLVLRGQLDRLREMCERARLPRSFGLTGSRRPAAPSPAGCG